MNGTDVASVWYETGSRRLGAEHEQLDAVRRRQRGHIDDHLVVQADRLSAGRQQHETWAHGKRFGQQHRRRHHVFAVVEHEKLSTASQQLHHLLAGPLIGGERHAQRGDKSRQCVVTRRNAREVHEADAVGVVGADHGGHRGRERRLADAARSCERDQAVPAQRPCHLLDQRGSTDQWACWREVGGRVPHIRARDAIDDRGQRRLVTEDLVFQLDDGR